MSTLRNSNVHCLISSEHMINTTTNNRSVSGEHKNTPTIPAPSIIYHFHGAEVLSTEYNPLPSEMLYVGCYQTVDKCLTIAAVPSSSSYFVLIYHAVHLEGNFLSRIKWWDVLYNDEANVDTFSQISSDIWTGEDSSSTQCWEECSQKVRPTVSDRY